MSTAAEAPTVPVCVFAKPPRPGEVKTRLGSHLGHPAAAALASAFLLDTAEGLEAIPGIEPMLATTGEMDDAYTSSFARTLWQGDGPLGARIERVLRAANPAGPAIAIGADSPGLPPALLRAAREALARADAVIGPAADGGFYLLGLRRCEEGLLADLPWSDPQTFARTLERLRTRGRVEVLPPWFDVDTAADLPRLHAAIQRGEIWAPRTRDVLARVCPPRVSVIIPTLNEADRISERLRELDSLGAKIERIVVDGGSDDGTLELARAHPLAIGLEAPRGRASQMNAGARRAVAPVLLFLHADVSLPSGWLGTLQGALDDPRTIAGAFKTWTVADEGRSRLGPLLHLADLRSRYTRLPYGDQALFVRRAAFDAVGGFPEQPLMEDVELSRRLRRLGRIARVGARVRVSGRRFEAKPLTMAVLVNVFPLLYAAGVPPRALERWYGWIR